MKLPGPLRRLWEGWLAIAGRFGEAQTLVLLGVVYGLVLGPMAVIAKLARHDPLERQPLRVPETAWREEAHRDAGLERAKQPF